MPRIALKPGENSIANAKPKRVDPETREVLKVQKGKGCWTLQWYANIAGETKRHFTKVDPGTKTSCRAAAYRRFQELLDEARLPGDGDWTYKSSMADFVTIVAIPTIEANEYEKALAPRSIDAYRRCLRRYAEQVGRMTIGNAVIPANIQRHLKGIALTSGNSTASQCRKVLSAYVFDLMALRRIIEYNPLKVMKIEAMVNADTDDDGEEPVRTLTPDERRCVVKHLLSLDPTMPPRKRWTAEQMTAKRSTLIDMTLLQATVGLRVSECRMLRASWIGDDGHGHLTVTVPAKYSKTRKGRTVPVLIDDVAERVRRRAQGPSDALLFPSPVAGTVWDSGNAGRALRAFYNELANELDIPVLREPGVLTHVWRRTLNSEWADYEVSEERRSAYFGHSPEVNRASYTDLVDLADLVSKVEGKM